MKLTDRRHAFWQSTRGPEDTPGESLHYIQGNTEWIDFLRKAAMDKGDDKWLVKIERMKSRQEPCGFTHPMFGWWMSQEAYERGDTGFGGIAKASVESENPNLTIHSTGAEAIAAWRAEEVTE